MFSMHQRFFIKAGKTVFGKRVSTLHVHFIICMHSEVYEYASSQYYFYIALVLKINQNKIYIEMKYTEYARYVVLYSLV